MSKMNRPPINCIKCNALFKQTVHHNIYCLSCTSSINNYKKNRLDYKWRLTQLTGNAKTRAKIKSIPCDIDSKYVISLWEANKGCCHLTGQPFELGPWDGGHAHPNAPSIDRVIPSLGYVRGNIRVITYHMNISLNEYGYEVFEKLAKDFLSRGVS